MAKVFVSYSRKDIEFAKRLTAELKKCELDFWIDWEGIPPTVDWWREIEKGIEEADVFIFLISPDSSASRVCGQEIDAAVKNAKRIVPLVVREVKGDEAPKQLSHLNWIFFRPIDDFEAAFQNLLTSIHTDYEWVQQHRWLQVRALDWARDNKDNSSLLRGKDLQDVEFQLATNSSKEPHPTDLQREYLFESRKATDRQRRTITSISIAGIILLAALAVYAFVQAAKATTNATTANQQRAIAESAKATAVSSEETAVANRQEALKQAAISHAGELAALALLEKDRNFDLSLLLGIEGFNTFENTRTRGTLLTLNDSYPNLTNFLFGHTRWVSSIAFSPEGIRMASGSADHTIILWDISKGSTPSKLAALNGHNETIESLFFSADGRQLTSVSETTVILWDISDPNIPRQLTKLSNFGSRINSPYFIFSIAGQWLASRGDKNSIILWDASNPTNPSQMATLPESELMPGTLVFSRDGTRLAMESASGISIWDLSNSKSPSKIASLPAATTGVPDMAFSADANKLAIGGIRSGITLWDISNPAMLTQPTHFSDPQSTIGNLSPTFSPDGSHLASISDHNTVILWDTNLQAPWQTAVLTGHSAQISYLEFSPDGNRLVSGDDNGTIIIWDVNAVPPSHLATFAAQDGPFSSLAFSPDGTKLAAGTGVSSIILWDIQNRLEPAKISETLLESDVSTNVVDSLAFNSKSEQLLSADDSNFTLWDIRDPLAPVPEVTLPIAGKDYIWRALSADGNRLVLRSANAHSVLWDIENPATPVTLGTLPVSAFALSPNSKLLASASADSDDSIVLWDISNLSKPSQLSVLSGQPTESIAFSHDGHMLAYGGEDNAIILWDISNPMAPVKLATLSGPPNTDSRFRGVWSLAFSADDKELASGGFYGITLWDLNSDSWVSRACQRAGRNFTRDEWTRYFPNDKYRKTCKQWD